MTTVSKSHRYPLRSLPLMLVLAGAGLAVVAGCSSPGTVPTPTSAEARKVVVVIDRTGVTESESWTYEVSSQTQEIAATVIADGAEDLDVVSMGSDAAAAAKVASVDLTDTSRNTSDKTKDAKADLARQVGQVAGSVAASPVTTNGTDVVAALQTAASLCRAEGNRMCTIYVFSDMEDSRILESADADEAVAQLQPLIPDLAGITVRVSGIGASESDADVVERVRAVWTELLASAAGTDLARSF